MLIDRLRASAILVALLFAVGILFQNCSGFETGESSTQDSIVADPVILNSIEIFAETLHPVLTTNCGACHGVNQLPLHSLPGAEEAHNILLQSALVSLVDPAQSSIVLKIRQLGGHEGVDPIVADELEAQIIAWADTLADDGVDDPLPTPVQLAPTFQSIHALILIPKCATCHNPNGTRPQEDYSDYASTVATGQLDGDFWEEIESGKMPKPPNPDLSAEEQAVIKEWLDAGALNN